ncbi:hypothetical protein NC652_009239 [Populus alba x Populus x berolinensis]|nr:hypothetical protein NC652_009239 [Populus alba x Populus x berolinensis]
MYVKAEPTTEMCIYGVETMIIYLVTYHFFHWKKGTPFADDQGIYNGLTWREQIETASKRTITRKHLAHNRLSKSNALLQHIGCICAGCCQVPKHAQGSHIRNQC